MKAIHASPLLKIAVIGPECTGKSELSQFLAKHYKTEWVPEYARGFLENLSRPYAQGDLLTIAHGQLRLEDACARRAKELLFCDTNLYVIKVWSQFKYGSVDDEILGHLARRPYDLYLLTSIDLPWVDDPQREHPSKRKELFDIYHDEMKKQPVPYAVISGLGDARYTMAVEAVEALRQKKKV